MDACAKIVQRDRHLPGVVTESCGVVVSFVRRTRTLADLHTGHVVPACGKQSRFLVELSSKLERLI